ncbi:hypothetical protein D3C76_1603400 [compost metagenome]
MVNRFGGVVDAIALGADDVNQWLAIGVQPVPGNSFDGLRAFAVLQIEYGTKEIAGAGDVAGPDGDVIKVHGYPLPVVVAKIDIAK